jgi:two-component system response regulator HydG
MSAPRSLAAATLSRAAAPVPPDHRVLVIGAGEDLAANLSAWGEETGIALEFAPDLPYGTRLLTGAAWDLVLAVVDDHPEEELEWWMETLRSLKASPRLIGLVSHPSMGLALRAERLGVMHLLKLPLQRDAFMQAIRRMQSSAIEVPIPLPVVPADAVGQYALIGQSPAMLEVYGLIARVATSSATVLILGESGTGKEVVARAIQLSGPRANRPFIAVNCAAIPDNLLESELFGHEKGAFTGAVMTRMGRFEQASGGTLFLDEIADMSLSLQAKILRAIQEREIERVGGRQVIPVDVRLMAATNRDLRRAVESGRFREDLYYRLAVVTLRLPNLSQRGDDLRLLTAHFARQFAQRYGKRIEFISDRALELMHSHPWVGNVRELRNVIERAVIIADGTVLSEDCLPEELRGAVLASNRSALPLSLAEAEARHIARVLEHTAGHINAAATILGIHRNTLARKMRQYGI